MEIKCIKSAAKLLNRGGLDLSKEVLWVSLGQSAAQLPAIKVGGLKKFSAAWPGAGKSGSNSAEWQNFFLTSNLTAGSSSDL